MRGGNGYQHPGTAFNHSRFSGDGRARYTISGNTFGSLRLGGDFPVPFSPRRQYTGKETILPIFIPLIAAMFRMLVA